jgi:hypothetical protein
MEIPMKSSFNHHIPMLFPAVPLRIAGSSGLVDARHAAHPRHPQFQHAALRAAPVAPLAPETLAAEVEKLREEG